MSKSTQKKFSVNYKVDSLREAIIKADNLLDALQKAQAMTVDELDKLTGAIVDEECRITSVFE